MSGLIPVNLSVEDAHAAAGFDTAAEVPNPPTPDELDNWSQEAYSLDVSSSTNLGFPVGNISATYKRQTLMFGTSRWKDMTANGNSYRFGVALRSIIVVSDIKGEAAITLPVVAAKVELEGARATAQLLVRGYTGANLAEKLPTWQTFGVDSYAQYMKAISDIQALVMADQDHIHPELLATTVLSAKVPQADAAVGVVYALHALEKGATQAHAIDTLKTSDAAVVDTVRNVYAGAVGEDERAVPNREQRDAAHEQLHGLHLSDGLFRR